MHVSANVTVVLHPSLGPFGKDGVGVTLLTSIQLAKRASSISKCHLQSLSLTRVTHRLIQDKWESQMGDGQGHWAQVSTLCIFKRLPAERRVATFAPPWYQPRGKRESLDNSSAKGGFRFVTHITASRLAKRLGLEASLRRQAEGMPSHRHRGKRMQQPFLLSLIRNGNAMKRLTDC